MAIDPSARVAPGVELAPDVEVGPGVIIDGPSTIGAGTRILAHAYIGPYTTIGAHNLIGFGAIVGYDPQDYAFTGEESYTIIGDHNIIREYVTIHRGTKPGSATRVGNHNFLMALSHMAHNSCLGNHVVVVNGALVGGAVPLRPVRVALAVPDLLEEAAAADAPLAPGVQAASSGVPSSKNFPYHQT